MSLRYLTRKGCRERKPRLRRTPKRLALIPITSALRRHLAIQKPAPRPGHTFMGFYDAATDRYGWQFIPTNGNQQKKGAA